MNAGVVVVLLLGFLITEGQFSKKNFKRQSVKVLFIPCISLRSRYYLLQIGEGELLSVLILLLTLYLTASNIIIVVLLF